MEKVLAIVLVCGLIYIAFKVGRSSGVLQVLDDFVDEYKEVKNNSIDFERNVKAYGRLLQSHIDYLEVHKDGMSQEEINRNEAQINDYKVRLKEAENSLNNEINNNLVLFEIEKAERESTKIILEKGLKRALKRKLIKQWTYEEYIKEME